ncbi:hypothetical protein NUACC26_050590 [Scytonema sp. NUACC26]
MLKQRLQTVSDTSSESVAFRFVSQADLYDDRESF